MADDFLTQLLGNHARARLLRVFLFNESAQFTEAQAAKRAGLPAAKAAREIKSLESLDIIKKGRLVIVLPSGKEVHGKQKVPTWSINPKFKYLRPLSMFVHEASPVHYKSILESLRRGGRIAAVVLSGSFVGDPSRPADLIVAADGVNESRLEAAVRGLEPQLGREIRYALFTTPEFRYRLTIDDRLIRETLDFPHLVLLDKTKLL